MGINKTDEAPEYILKLFVSGASANSVRAINNLKKILDKYMKQSYDLEIIDIYQQGDIARNEQLVALPLLVKKLPLPERKLVGDMSDTNKVLDGLGILM